MNLKHVKMREGGQAEVLIYDEIGDEGVRALYIASEINWLIKYEDISELLIRVNSGGGSMIEGFGIVSALQSAVEKGVKLITQNDGLAASMAGPILAMGQKVKAKDFSLIMLHNPLIYEAETLTDKEME